MKILVTGAGRGGTNLATELIKKMNIVTFTSNVEDRNLFNYGAIIDNYGTKLATENKGFTLTAIDSLMKNNEDLHVVFVTRHPVDNCLSKIVRGQPKSKGGDSMVEELAPDATIEGSINALNHTYKIHKHLFENYPDRLLTFKMEDLIENSREVVIDVANKFNILIPHSVYDFYKSNRNRYQKARYGDELHKQVDLYKDLVNNFDGFFVNKLDYVEELFDKLDVIIKYFKYE